MPTNNLPLALADTAGPVAGPDLAPALVALYDRSLDSVEGYSRMVKKADPSLRDRADRFRALHAHHAEVLSRLLSDRGVETKADGSAIGPVDHTAVTFRAFFDDIDEDLPDQMRSGEGWVLRAFDAAIAEQAAASPALLAMRAELNKLLADFQGPD